MAYLEPQYPDENEDFTKDVWFTKDGPFGISGFNDDGKEIGLCCYVCNVQGDSRIFMNHHYESKKHISKIKSIRNPRGKLIVESSTGDPDDPDNMFLENFCKVCNAQLSDEDRASAHYMSERHQKKVRHYFLVKVGAKPSQPEPKHSADSKGSKPSIDVNDHMSYCKLCKAEFHSPMAAHDHYGGKKHAKKVRDQGKHQMRAIQTTPKTRGVDRTVWRKCDVCDVCVNSDQQLVIHMQSPKHKNMVAKMRMNSQAYEAQRRQAPYNY